MMVLNQKSDSIGVVASAICLVHCVATPFVFIAHSCHTIGCANTPLWWTLIDYLFLIISFVAVYQSTKTTSKQWIKPALWLSWLFLFMVIINEKNQILSLNDSIIYFPTILLVGLHLYNKKYCKCTSTSCCTDS